MNKTVLVFETTADIADFLKRRKITHGVVDAREVTVTAVLTDGDILFAQKEYKARVMRKGKGRVSE